MTKTRTLLTALDIIKSEHFQHLIVLINIIVAMIMTIKIKSIITIKIIIMLTYSTVQSPSWEADWFAASQEIPAFHGTQRFITALTSVRHLSLSWDSPIQSIYPHPTSWRSVLILSNHLRLGLPSGYFIINCVKYFFVVHQRMIIDGIIPLAVSYYMCTVQILQHRRV